MVERLRPEVVLMDLNMPVVDGFDATSIIMEEHPTTKVVTLSVHSLEAVRELALKSGASHFFCKDGNPEELDRNYKGLSPAARPHGVLIALEYGE